MGPSTNHSTSLKKSLFRKCFTCSTVIVFVFAPQKSKWWRKCFTCSRVWMLTECPPQALQVSPPGFVLENINLDLNFSHEHSISHKLSKSDHLVLENINVIIIFENSPLPWSGMRGGRAADHRSITRGKGKTGKGLGRRVLPKKHGVKHEHSNLIAAVIKPWNFCVFETNCTLGCDLIAKDRPWNNSESCACPHVPHFKPLKRNPACEMLFRRSWDKCWGVDNSCSNRKMTTLPGVERKACGYLDHEDYTNKWRRAWEKLKSYKLFIRGQHAALETSMRVFLRGNLRAGKPATPPGMSRVARQLPSCFTFLSGNHCHFCRFWHHFCHFCHQSVNFCQL